MQTSTSDFLDAISLSGGIDGLFLAANQAKELAQTEPDITVSGALVLLRFALVTIAHDLDSGPPVDLGEARLHQIEALVAFVRKRDATSLAGLAGFASL